MHIIIIPAYTTKPLPFALYVKINNITSARFSFRGKPPPVYSWWRIDCNDVLDVGDDDVLSSSSSVAIATFSIVVFQRRRGQCMSSLYPS